MKTKLLIYIFIFSLCVACSKDDEKVKTSGEVTLSSQLITSGSTYVVEGFSLEQAKKITFTLTATPIPDLILENNLAVEGANLTSPQNDEAFFKVGDFTNSQEAEAAFSGLTEAGDHSYTPTAPEIKANQVYIFKTRGDKYAKLLIKNYNLNTSGPQSFVEATIRWVYQPDGEKTFPVSK